MDAKDKTPTDAAFSRLASSIQNLRTRVDSLMGSLQTVRSAPGQEKQPDEPPPPAERTGSSPLVERLEEAADELDRLRVAIESCEHDLEI